MTEVAQFESKSKDGPMDNRYQTWPRRTLLFESNIGVYPNLPEKHFHKGPKDKIRSYIKT